MFKLNKLSPFALMLVFAAAWSLAMQSAHAYLDPGTGSYLFQIALASLFGALFAIKMFWLQIKTFFLKLLGKAPTPNSESAQPAKGQKKDA